MSKQFKNPKNIFAAERLLAIVAIATIIVAWFVGAAMADTDISPQLVQVFPSAGCFQAKGNDIYAAYDTQSQEVLLGYVGVRSANGYAGPIKVAVVIDLEGNILNLAILKHNETPAWMREVQRSGLFERLIGKKSSDAISLGDDIDGVTGATYTSRAIVDAVRSAVRQVASAELSLQVQEEEKPKIIFGIPEITLLGLFAIGFIGAQRRFKYTKQLRWVSMLIGLIVIGFIYNSPLTITYINKLLIGYFPNWRTNLYWYMLIGGILFVYTVHNKNPYCDWFCPFGAAQECMGAIGGSKLAAPRKYRNLFVWIQRGLAWFAIIVALIFRNPGLSSYEVFGTLFALTGSKIQFIILGAVLIVSLFYHRPWCNFFCPLRPVTDLIRLFRKWILEIWKKLNLTNLISRT
jgi:NosR/NirI family nitrous oxide reductase transcriptional regulator